MVRHFAENTTLICEAQNDRNGILAIFKHEEASAFSY